VCPVALYTAASSSERISLHILNRDTGHRVKRVYVDSDTGKPVPAEEQVKGYAVAENEYVVLEPEELKALEEKATSTIDIIEFVPLASVDREYLDKVYYLGPDKNGDRAYRLLAEALKETGKAGLGQYAARGQQHLVLLRPNNGVLVMEQLLYSDELRPTTEVTVPAGEVREGELKLAKLLIEQTSNDAFEPAKYRDTVRERVLEAIQDKVGGQEITADVVPGADTKMLDLMEALKASLAKEKPETPKKEKAEKKRKAS